MKLKKKFRKYILLLPIILIIVIIVAGTNKKETVKEIKINDDFMSLHITNVKELCYTQGLKCNYTGKYNYDVSKDIVYNSKKNGDTYDIEYSLGEIEEDKLREDKINENGKVPIMMYHKIVNQDSTNNIGGNVDKDGYNRLVSYFRQDLDFYYNNDYRFIKLGDYIKGDINVEYGKSPIILTFDDGNEDNCKVNGLDGNGNLIIDPNSACGVMEEFKKNHPDSGITAIFFLNKGLFNQPEYNDKIIKWLIEKGYSIGNHTISHVDFTTVNASRSEQEVGEMYSILENIIPDDYEHIVALPYGSPYKRNHSNYSHIINSNFNGKSYVTEAALRVGWEPEDSPYSNDFDPTFLKRCRAYNFNGKEFDLDMVFKSILPGKRFISDGFSDIITIPEAEKNNIKSNDRRVVTY